MSGRLDGKVAIVTGAGRGIGRAHALELARAGASVLVNDLGVEPDGTGKNAGPADAVVAEILSAGGLAIANTNDITDWRAAGQIVDAAVAAFGTVDILINNAAVSRFGGPIDAISQEDWALTLGVNLGGTAAMSHWVSALWRREGARSGRAIVNTASPVGLMMSSSVELPNASYAASKAGIAAFTIACAIEVAELGVRVNAIVPVARSRVSEFVAPHLMIPPSEGFDRMAPENVSAVVAYLASPECPLTGKILGIKGSDLTVLKGWSVAHEFTNGDQTWTHDALDAALALLER